MKTRPIVLIALGVIALIAVSWLSNRSVSAQDQAKTNRMPREAKTAPSSTAGDTPEIPRTKSADRPPDTSRTGKLDDDFDPASYQRRPVVGDPGVTSDAAIAYVQIPSTNRRTALIPNSLGEYEAQPTLTGETVGVRLRIEEVAPGTPVAVVILDGGSFPDGSGPSKVVKLGRDSLISFRYTTSENIGYHRIRVLPSGGTARVFDFTASGS
jgi:hypothetical protein